jgi:hypothetical protein
VADGATAPTANNPATTMLTIRNMALERDMTYSFINDLTGGDRPNSHKKSHPAVRLSQVDGQVTTQSPSATRRDSDRHACGWIGA